MSRKLRSALILALVALSSGAAAMLAMRHITFLRHVESIVEDIRTATLLPQEPQDEQVVIAAVTEDTLNLFPYRSPVDREFLANLLWLLAERKPKVIGVDILFDQETETEKDALLRQTIDQLQIPLVISYIDNPQYLDDRQQEFIDKFTPPAMRAYANLGTDASDVVRSIFPGANRADDSYVPGFARAVAERAGVEQSREPEEMVWRGRPDAETKPFKIYPAHVLAALPADWFQDKIVLIGEIVSLTDRQRTPFTAVYGAAGDWSGIEVQANAVSQLVNHRHTRRLGLTIEIGLVLLMILLGAISGTLHSQLMLQVGQGALILGALWAGGFALLRYTGSMIPLVEPSLAFLLATWGADALSGRAARRQKEFIQSAFTLYLNPHMVKQLANDPGRLKLGGEMRDMTLLFCDIRGFTTIAERFDAHGLTRFINRFLTPMTDVIQATEGTIDKYMGDAIMAFWNAPLDDDKHAEHACRAALAMRAELVRLNDEWQAEAQAEGVRFDAVRIGIGLNTGECCVGNLGSDQKFNYSVLGDDVNLCSRLEGQTKTYSVDVVISEATATKAPMLAALEIDLIRVKGKTRPVRVFALVGDEAVAENPAFQALTANHNALMAAYRAKDWTQALAMLNLCRGEAPELMQGLYTLYEERIALFRFEPPPVDWDGVYVAESK